jgi:Domain of unknown function (DUF4281)
MMDTLFNIANLTVLPFWIIMIALPRWPWAVRVIRSPLIALPPALIYAAIVLPLIAQGGLDFSSFGSLAGVMGLLASPQGAAAGWAHFLAFDLFVGRWVYLDALEPRIHPALLALPLFFVFMLGPIGFLLYLAARWLARRSTR